MDTSSVELIPGVRTTLALLGARHRLCLVTRGEPAEQWAKVESSGLQTLFESIAVVTTKTVETYIRLTEEWGSIRRRPG